jgi:small-conductance mechanosensitive channel
MQQRLDAVIVFLTRWLETNVLTWTTAAQWGVAAGCLALAVLLWRLLDKRIRAWVDERVRSALGRAVVTALLGVGASVVFLLLLQVGAAVFIELDTVPRVILAVSDLAVAWIVIRLVTGMMSSPSLARIVAVGVWTVAALSVFGLLAPVTGFLDGLSVSVGSSSFTVLGAIKGLALAAIFLQGAALASHFAAGRILAMGDISPSIQVLLIKTVKVLLFTAAVLFALSSVGIDLTSLAIFSSALGVGIGFGLKTIFSNYVAGVLLLMDKSIKPGDTIEVGGVFGVVRGMFSRYTSVLTRDGKEYLIPNELLISGEVVNWTYSDTNVRLKLPVGVAYESDVELALRLLEEAAGQVDRVLRSPEPLARLMGFGDSSVDLELRLWIADANMGVTNVCSDVYLVIWRLFHEHGVQFPFPQRDVLLKTGSKLAVTIDKGENHD